jgi:hypothetical protein
VADYEKDKSLRAVSSNQGTIVGADKQAASLKQLGSAADKAESNMKRLLNTTLSLVKTLSGGGWANNATQHMKNFAGATGDATKATKELNEHSKKTQTFLSQLKDSWRAVTSVRGPGVPVTQTAASTVAVAAIEKTKEELKAERAKERAEKAELRQQRQAAQAFGQGISSGASIANSALQATTSTLGIIGDQMQWQKTGSMSGLAELAGTGNRMYDRIRQHDISDLAAFTIAERNKGKLLYTQGAATASTLNTGGLTPEQIKQNVTLGGPEQKRVSETVGGLNESDMSIQSRVLSKGGGAILGILGGIGGIGSGGAGGIANAVGSIGNAFTGVTGALADEARAKMSFESQRVQASAAEVALESTKQINYKQIRAVQNLVDKAEMLAPIEQRTGAGYSRALGAAMFPGSKQYSGMSMGEAAQYSIGISDAFGGRGAMDSYYIDPNTKKPVQQEGLLRFGARMQAGGVGRGSTMAQLAGQATAGMLTDMSQTDRAQKGAKIIENAVARGAELGVLKGNTDPQSREALATAVSQASQQWGGANTGLTDFLLRGMSSKQVNPEELRQRMGALQGLGQGMGQNPWMQAQSLALANQATGGYDHLGARILGEASIGELMFGGENSDVARAGFTGEQRLTQAKGLTSNLITTMRAQFGKGMRDLSDEDFLKAVSEDKTLSARAGESMRGLAGFTTDRATNERMLPMLQQVLGADSIEDVTSKLKPGDFKQWEGGAGKGAAGFKASTELKEITRLFTDPAASQVMKDVFASWTKFYDDMAEKPPIQDPNDAISVIKSVESLIKTIIDGGGSDKVAATNKAIEDAIKQARGTPGRTNVSRAAPIAPSGPPGLGGLNPNRGAAQARAAAGELVGEGE